MLLVILIFNPTIERKGSFKKKLLWHIYVDNSLRKAQSIIKKPSEVSYKSGIQNFLKKIKDKGLIFKTFSFGSFIDSLENITELKLNGNSTNLDLIFNKINSDYQKNIAGVVIFTDGQINQGPPIQQFYRNNNNLPVFTIGVGDTTPMLDISIKSVKSPPLSVKGANVDIEVTISSIGNINERVNVNLFDEKK